MTRMTRPDCAVMYNLINTQTHTHTPTPTPTHTHTHIHTHTNIHTHTHTHRWRRKGKEDQETQKSCRRDVGNGGDLGRDRKNVYNEVLVQ